MPSSPRLIALLAAISMALAGCDPSPDDGCPGRTFVRLALHGTLDPAGTGCNVDPPGGWNVPATVPSGKPDDTYDAELSWDEGAQQLAYCTGGPHGAVLLGTRSGDHLTAQVTVAGAVLGQCAATCTPLMTVTFDGDLASASSPMTFAGTLTETFDGGAGDCGACQLPCTSTYLLAGTAR